VTEKEVQKRVVAAKAPNLVVVGSVALDILHTATASSGLVLGGSAVHFTNAASFFSTVGVVGVIGDDYPQGELAFLKKRGADFSGVEMRSGKSFLWEGRYAQDFLSRETLRTELGVFADFKPVLPAHFRKPKVLFLAAIHPQLQWDVLLQVERPKLVAIDTFKLWIDTAQKEFLKVLKRCDLLFVNDDEVRWLTGEHNLLKGSQALRKLGPQWIVVKKGEHGSFVVGEQGVFLSHTFPVPHVTDPTGAGDAYAGGLLGYLASCARITETEIRRGMGWASVIGSFYVEEFGVDGLKQKTRAAVAKRYRDFIKLFAVP
jgi:sugar/nucleoside kinase (ribokinase family)